MFSIVLIGLENADEKKVLETVKKFPMVKEANIVFGEWDVVLKVESKSTDDLRNFLLEKIRHIKGVKLTTTLICAE
jgi:anthranilate phosphoribosyltransferase